MVPEAKVKIQFPPVEIAETVDRSETDEAQVPVPTVPDTALAISGTLKLAKASAEVRSNFPKFLSFIL